MLNGTKAVSLRWAIPAAVACAAVSAALFAAQPAQADEYDSSVPVGNFSRIAGATALDTNAKIVSKYIEAYGANYDRQNVILVTKDLYHDALSASALAGQLNCPIVLTGSTKLSAQSADAISGINNLKVSDKDMSPKQIKEWNNTKRKENKDANTTLTVWIVGGEKVVYKQVEKDLAELTQHTGVKYEIKRIAGDYASDTSLKVAETIDSLKKAQKTDSKKDFAGNAAVEYKTFYVATSADYFDALSIFSMADAGKTPIFLTNSMNKLDQKALDQIKKDGYNSVTIVGGPNAVDTSVDAALRGVGVGSVIRVFGETGYDTSCEFARTVVNGKVDDGSNKVASNITLATGWGYQDAMSAAPLAAKTGNPVLIADDTNYTAALDVVKAIKDKDKRIESGTIFGGKSVVSETVRLAFEDAISDLKVTLTDADGNVMNAGEDGDPVSHMWFRNTELTHTTTAQETVYFNQKEGAWYLVRSTDYTTLKDVMEKALKDVQKDTLADYVVNLGSGKDAVSFNGYLLDNAQQFKGVAGDGHSADPGHDEQLALKAKYKELDTRLKAFQKLLTADVTPQLYAQLDAFNSDTYFGYLGDVKGAVLKQLFVDIKNINENPALTTDDKTGKLRAKYKKVQDALKDGGTEAATNTILKAQNYQDQLDAVDYSLHGDSAKKADWDKHTFKLEASTTFVPCLAYQYYTVKIDGASATVKPTTEQVTAAHDALQKAIDAAANTDPMKFATYLDAKFVGADTQFYKATDKARLLQGVTTEDFFKPEALVSHLPADVSSITFGVYKPQK